jgi:CDP-diacylglycerol--glycerol-3-phosphate 3-phosphatidyltransferase
MKKYFANLITSLRIVFSIALLFLKPLSHIFIILYIAAGITDMIDGTVARENGTVSKFGSKLDTVADLVMVVVCLIKLIPVIHIPSWLVVWIILIAMIKTANLITGYVVRKEVVALHTVMNKLTGLFLFLLPLTLSFIDLKYSGSIVSILATVAAIQDGHLSRTGSKKNVP